MDYVDRTWQWRNAGSEICQALQHYRGDSLQDLVFLGGFQRKWTELKVWRRGQKKVMEQGPEICNNNSVCQFPLCNGDTPAEGSSCGFMPEAAEGVDLQARVMDGQVGRGSESSRSSKGPLWGSEGIKDQRDASEAYRRRSEGIKDQRDASEIGFEGLHLLADTAIWMLQTDQADVPPQHREGRDSSQQWVRKAIFFLTGESYLQKRVIRRARSAYRKIYGPPGAAQTHDMQNLKSAISESLTADNAISKLGQTQDSDQAAGRPNRRVVQTMPSRYCDSVLNTSKLGTKR